MPEVKEFLNPRSMLTPGIAGALTTGIAMPLVISFDLRFKWVALIIGFMLSLLIVKRIKENISRTEKSIYCILNTLIIFSVSVGAGINIDPPPKPSPIPVDPDLQKIIERSRTGDAGSEVIRFLGMSQALAQEPGEVEQPQNDTGEQGAEEAEQQKLTDEEIRKLEEYVKQQEKQTEEQQKYQRRWSW